MEPSPAPHESPAKDVEKPIEPGSLSRFKRLTRHLFGVDRAEFQEAPKRTRPSAVQTWSVTLYRGRWSWKRRYSRRR